MNKVLMTIIIIGLLIATLVIFYFIGKKSESKKYCRSISVSVNFGNDRIEYRIVDKVTLDVYNYISNLRTENCDLKRENGKLDSELKSIKPIVEKKELKPAISENCEDCIYCIKSPFYRKDILGCIKDNVCDDFKKGE